MLLLCPWLLFLTDCTVVTLVTANAAPLVTAEPLLGSVVGSVVRSIVGSSVVTFLHLVDLLQFRIQLPCVSNRSGSHHYIAPSVVIHRTVVDCMHE